MTSFAELRLFLLKIRCIIVFVLWVVAVIFENRAYNKGISQASEPKKARILSRQLLYHPLNVRFAAAATKDRTISSSVAFATLASGVHFFSRMHG